MDEMAKAKGIEMSGPPREAALAKFRRQIDAWGLVMPSARPLVLDFGLGRFDEVGLIEYWIANEIEAGYCGKYLFVFDGQTCPMHHHRGKHETFIIVKGEVTMRCSGKEITMSPGDVLPVAPGLVHSFTGVGPALLLEVSKPCLIEDNFFEDRRIPIGGR